MNSPADALASWHWCWLRGKQRVKRLGSALECRECRRYTKKHKCGTVPEYRNAWKDYPLEDCVACTKTGPPAEAPDPTVVEQRKPSDKEPGKGKVTKVNPRKKLTRIELRKNKGRRKQLLLVAIAHGVETAGELLKVLEAFGVVLKRRALYDDLTTLVEERWLEREQVERDTEHKWQNSWQWHYTINPAITERLSTDGTG